MPEVELVAGPGEVLWYPAGVAHAERIDARNPLEIYFLGFEWPDMPASIPRQLTDTADRLLPAARWLFDEREAPANLRDPMAEGCLRVILAELVRLSDATPDDLIVRLRNYMRTHLRDALTLDQLASVSKTSKYHLIRRYRALTGRTPMQDLRHLRLEAARDLLLTTSLPLKQIAPKIGLTDEYHLSRLFRRHFHITASQLRQRRTIEDD